MTEIRFGIVGTGGIADKFARALAMTDGAHAAAVCSRTEENARRFAEKNGIARTFTDVRRMAESGEVDIVYVATPHPMHFNACMDALKGGVAVLCEKPMCLSRAQAEALFTEAERRGLFLMEGMWTRFLPNSVRAKAWIDAGRIGRVRFIDAMFSCGMGENPVPRLVLPELGGGGLFDIGVYAVEMAAYYAGAEASAWESVVEPHVPGVDALCAITARYPGGALATLRAGIVCEAPANLTVYGETGRIELPRFFSAREARLYEGDTLTERFVEDCELPRGFVYEIEAVAGALREGLTRHPVMPPSATIAAAEMMEDVMHRAFPEFY